MIMVRLNESQLRGIVRESVKRCLLENVYANQYKKIISAIHTRGKELGWSKDEISRRISEKLAQLQAESDINRYEAERRMKLRGSNVVNDKTTDPLANTDFSNGIWDIDMNDF